MGYDNVSAKTSNEPGQNDVNASYPKLIGRLSSVFHTGYENLVFSPMAVFSYFKKTNSEVYTYQVNLQLDYIFSLKTKLGIGYRYQAIDFDFEDKETIIELEGKKSFPYLGFSHVWL